LLPDRSRDSPPTSLSPTNRQENPRIPESATEEIEEETDNGQETTDNRKEEEAVNKEEEEEKVGDGGEGDEEKSTSLSRTFLGPPAF